jgi:transcriptional regulator with XRE-family HTH domain
MVGAGDILEVNTVSENVRSLDPDRDYERLGARLREAREYLGLSQELVAESLGVPRASISDMEGGKRKVSSLELRDLSRLYKRPISFFLGDQETYAESAVDKNIRALHRATKDLSPEDQQQLIRFAEFLRDAGGGTATSGKSTRRSRRHGS